MLNMSDLPTQLQSAEKSWTFSFKDTSLDSAALNRLGMFPRQNWVRKLTFLLAALNLNISFPLTN